MAGPIRREDITIGWVCALYIELAAAQEMLDDQYQDHNFGGYTVGRIGKHNIVMGCLPDGQTGNNSAAVVAIEMKSAFPSIQSWLMVGIGGGVPSEEADIRLGDIVVSSPGGTYGGVVQYDFGKDVPGEFVRKGSLNSPSRTLLKAVANLRANHMRGKPKFLEYIARFDRLPKFSRERAGRDVLFRADYRHMDGIHVTPCDRCNEDKVIVRDEREQGDEVMVHYGIVASANRVMRDATTRDKISTGLGGVLCFEMEAAGLMNDLQCIVIRGISDYADSHKNKKWQLYAAGTAAAYAKEIVTLIPAQEGVTEITKAEFTRGSDVHKSLALASNSEPPRQTRPNPTLSSTGPNPLASNIAGSNFVGPTLILSNATGSNFTFSNSAAPKPAVSKTAVSNGLKRKKTRQDWIEDEDFEEDLEEDRTTSRIRCYSCGRPGHIAPDCRDTCFDCGEVGHWAGDPECDRQRETCYRCGRVGHWQDECNAYVGRRGRY
ncbi:hypothetical protein TWF281_007584 [Arthrobotrys megalospora]